jgi:hypothetical protein
MLYAPGFHCGFVHIFGSTLGTFRVPLLELVSYLKTQVKAPGVGRPLSEFRLFGYYRFLIKRVARKVADG